MNIRMYINSVAIAAVLALTACSKQETVSFNTAETARQTAFENANWNAEAYRNNSPRLEGLKVVPHGDDTIDNECPWGSGWAQISIMGQKDPATKAIEKHVVFCSTVSSSRGCFIEKDFREKPFGKDFGHCAPKGSVPFPIQKIVK